MGKLIRITGISTEDEDYKRIGRVIDFCSDCVIQESCRKYCKEAEKVRDGK